MRSANSWRRRVLFEGEMDFGKTGGEEVDEVWLLEGAKVGNNMVGEKGGIVVKELRRV